MTEDEFLTAVVDLAKLTRWRIHHCRPARRANGGWSTPIQGHQGFPDLVMIRGSRLLWVELKTNRGLLTGDQKAWRDRLLYAGQDWRCWRPKDWPEIEATLATAPHSNLRPPETTITTGGRV